ncbi:MAG: hypothetical protein ACXWPK_10245 [Isosphaeraceae bacterium]
MNTPEGRQFAASMDWAPGRAELRIDGRTACDCGCGRPARIEFSLDGYVIGITSPAAVDAAIETLQAARRKLWGEP